MAMKDIVLCILNALTESMKFYCKENLVPHEDTVLQNPTDYFSIWIDGPEKFRQNSTIIVRNILHPLLRKAITEEKESK